ncbi:Zinc finger, C2H2 type family protein [Tritrichomonas foetus]|uniref:Zinc finger, C2H2 type family protein n=1 Tax=Tritrichomonas foetus TaxID=1144522 RepID=A0A1J4JFB9_9EUKA|nr:Zinc finger, C2H2 type family protein [Tritrichomonas foetus]|eukprot:OHS96149.1 Zinc finger, C2H2 type family protein [Tritrichomonas foetus]
MENEKEHCFFCMEPIKYRVFLPCDHNNMCINCYIRDTRCYHHTNCYYCQKPLEGHPIVSTDLSIQTYSQGKSKRPKYDSKFQIFYFDRENVHDFISSLFHFTCPECSLSMSAFDMFASHVKIHKMRVCQICHASNRFLPGDLPVFKSNKEYQTHLQQQHPRCQCCPNQICFDHDALAKHMLEKHHRCEICAKQNIIKWFKDAAELISHHEKCHFICHYPQCSTHDLIAFATRGELMIHLQTVHNERPGVIDLADFADDDRNDKPRNIGENESIVRKKELNRKFMQRLNEVLTEEDKEELMKAARFYVSSKISAEEFYSVFVKTCAQEKDSLFNDMVAFLPLPEKRAELNRIHVRSSSITSPQQVHSTQSSPSQFTTNSNPNNNSNNGNNHNNRYTKNGNKNRNRKNHSYLTNATSDDNLNSNEPNIENTPRRKNNQNVNDKFRFRPRNDPPHPPPPPQRPVQQPVQLSAQPQQTPVVKQSQEMVQQQGGISVTIERPQPGNLQIAHKKDGANHPPPPQQQGGRGKKKKPVRVLISF